MEGWLTAMQPFAKTMKGHSQSSHGGHIYRLQTSSLKKDEMLRVRQGALVKRPLRNKCMSLCPLRQQSSLELVNFRVKFLHDLHPQHSFQPHALAIPLKGSSTTRSCAPIMYDHRNRAERGDDRVCPPLFLTAPHTCSSWFSRNDRRNVRG